MGDNPLVSAVTDATGTITTTVDLLNRPTQVVDVWAKTTTFGYDQPGRLTTRSGPEGTQAWTYDAAGAPTAQSLDGAVVADRGLRHRRAPQRLHLPVGKRQRWKRHLHRHPRLRRPGPALRAHLAPGRRGAAQLRPPHLHPGGQASGPDHRRHRRQRIGRQLRLRRRRAPDGRPCARPHHHLRLRGDRGLRRQRGLRAPTRTAPRRWTTPPPPPTATTTPTGSPATSRPAVRHDAGLRRARQHHRPRVRDLHLRRR